jgi:hypothetical protein
MLVLPRTFTAVACSCMFSLISLSHFAAQPAPLVQRLSSLTVGDKKPLQSRPSSLARFGDAHRDCLLWTNWNQMCSRTGESGAAYCVYDKNYTATASEPFCAISNKGPETIATTPKERASRNRFCADYLKDSDRRNTKKTHRCVLYSSNRPFNGMNLSSRIHPWCLEWRDARTQQIVCQAGPNRRADQREC